MMTDEANRSAEEIDLNDAELAASDRALDRLARTDPRFKPMKMNAHAPTTETPPAPDQNGRSVNN